MTSPRMTSLKGLDEIVVRALEKGLATENQFSPRHFRLTLLDFREI